MKSIECGGMNQQGYCVDNKRAQSSITGADHLSRIVTTTENNNNVFSEKCVSDEACAFTFWLMSTCLCRLNCCRPGRRRWIKLYSFFKWGKPKMGPKMASRSRMLPPGWPHTTPWGESIHRYRKRNQNGKRIYGVSSFVPGRQSDDLLSFNEDLIVNLRHWTGTSAYDLYDWQHPIF